MKLEGGATFVALLKGIGVPAPEPEYRFWPGRKFRFDYAWPAFKVALEVEGGAFSGGRHTRGSGFRKDAEKYSEAAAMGWRIIRVLPEQLCEARTLGWVARSLGLEDDVSLFV
jgi:hypothetical protein